MKPKSLFFAAALLAAPITFSFTRPAAAQAPPPTLEGYQPGPYEPGLDSKPQPGVPKGEVLKFSFENSKIFPGTYRDYWVYIPAQYSPDKPACVYVNQDGVQWNAPQVFDNLIAKGEMPVTIGVFIVHGRVRAKDGKTALDRFNRSYEYDGLGDAYARFVLEELLPDVETKKASDGRVIRLSKSGNDRAIGGSSSGAVCAWTAAWERPDAFSRVFSVIGTYVGLRGAEEYPTLVRKYEPKPLRVFLQDGVNDQNIYAGDWWMENQMMNRALLFAGYDVRHIWGEGGHDGRQGSAVFPDAMRYLWKDWPKPVEAGRSKNRMMIEILLEGETWQQVGNGYAGAYALAANAQEEVVFADTDGKGYFIATNGSIAPSIKNPIVTQAFGPDGRRFVLNAGRNSLVSYDANGKTKQIASGVPGTSMVVGANGAMYVAGTERNAPGVSVVSSNGKKTFVSVENLRKPGGVTLSPDQTLLYIADNGSHWVYSYQIQPDGSLDHGQRYYWLHIPDDTDDSGAGAMVTDRDGRLYVATRMGVQVADQAGRVNVILPVPGGTVTSLAFGGSDFDTLYATAGGKVYQRKMKAKGTQSFAAPLRPNPPGL